MKLNLIVSTIACLNIYVSSLYSQSNDLDPSFDNDGVVIMPGTDPLAIHLFAYDVVVQPDGKIVTAGQIQNAITDFLIIRYNPDGTLDSSFDSDGIATTAIGLNEDEASCIALQADGKILAAGHSSGNGFAIVRYNTDGSLDSSFNLDGITTTSIGAYAGIESMAIQTDGKIVVAGFSSSDEFIIARYNTDGSLDNSFDLDGIQSIGFGGSYEEVSAIALQADDKIVVSGNSGSDFAIARMNTNGSLDNSFGSGGIITTHFATYGVQSNCMTIQGDGKILLAGRVIYGGSSNLAIARYHTNGVLDNTFDLDGLVITDDPITDYDAYSDMAITSTGKILGLCYWGGEVIAYNPDGTIAGHYSPGSVIDVIGSLFHGIAVQADDNIIIAGYQDGGIWPQAVARYLQNPELGIMEDLSEKNVVIYPNPVQQNTILEYHLSGDEIISIKLIDMQGEIIHSFIENVYQTKGIQQINLVFPDHISQGSYMINLISNRGAINIKVIK